MTKPKYRIKVLPNGAGRWYWHKERIRGGQIVSTAGEDFDKFGNAKRAAKTELEGMLPGTAILVVLP